MFIIKLHNESLSHFLHGRLENEVHDRVACTAVFGVVSDGGGSCVDAGEGDCEVPWRTPWGIRASPVVTLERNFGFPSSNK